MARKKLLIIDGLNIIRRNYEAIPAPDRDIKAEGTLNSSHRSLLRAIREHEPTHCVMAMDSPGKNWRHDLYDGYKALRAPMPDVLREEINRYLTLPGRAIKSVLSEQGAEADDIIGSLTKVARAQPDPMDVVILSTDKDMVYLLTLGATIYNHFDYSWRDLDWCSRKFGIPPEQMPDLLALTGDPVDGVPGVAKVGVKTAAKLLTLHGDLEGVLAAASTIKGVVGNNLREQADLARLSRVLVQLKMDLFPSDFDLEQFRVA